MTSGPNLPRQLTSFIGRQQEIAEIVALLDTVALLTLTGPGGGGKTRLALAVAADPVLAQRFAGGRYWVSLAAIPDAALVIPTIARSLGVPEVAGAPLLAGIAAALGATPAPVLLILDNFEHLASAAPLVAELLEAAPPLQVLVTSRVPLRLYGEQLYPVPLLPVPAPAAPAALAAPADVLSATLLFGQYDAVRLFVERARAVRPGFALTEENAEPIAAICRRLDGLPLAIELAAARVKILSSRELLGRLDDSLGLLTQGALNRPARQQTMRDSIAWSYTLLSEAEKRLLRRLAVFAGGWTVPAAEVVAAAAGPPGLAVLDGLSALLDKSLLQETVPGTGETRFLILQTIREYGLEELATQGETAATQDAHAAYYAHLLAEWAATDRGGDQAAGLARFEAEHPNFRAALHWCLAGAPAGDPLAAGRAALALHLATGLARSWEMAGYLGEGHRWLEAALAAGADAPGPLRAEAHNGAGTLAFHLGDPAGAVEHYEAARGLWRTAGDARGITVATGNLATVAFREGQYARAAALYRDVLAAFRARDERSGVANTLHNLGNVALARADYGAAAAFYDEALALRRVLQDQRGSAASLNGLAGALAEQGRMARAVTAGRESLQLREDLGIRPGIADSLELLARLAVSMAQWAPAARLFGAAAGIRQGIGQALAADERAAHEAKVAILQEHLDAATRAALWAEGRALPLPAALALARAQWDALDRLADAAEAAPALALRGAQGPPRPEPGGRPAYPGGLTRREVEVLRLVATGLSDVEVAERLVLSPHTVHVHLRSIYGKLGVTNRLEAARFALDHQLA